MTPEEAIEIIDLYCGHVYKPKKMKEAFDMAIEALKEVQQYREIGTVEECKELASIVNMAERNEFSKVIDEWLKYSKIGTVDECREAKEKQIPIPVKNRTIMREFYGHPYSIRGDCPKCGSKALMSTLTDYCNACGQHLKWSDPEEKCESGKEDE